MSASRKTVRCGLINCGRIQLICSVSMDIPVRTLECCSGDLADLKVKSVDVEAWSPRQKKYFEVGSCSNLRRCTGKKTENPCRMEMTVNTLHIH